MELLQSRMHPCPYCGEAIELLIDSSAGDQEYVEDCQVCCQPMLVTVSTGEAGELAVTTAPENG